MFRFTIRDVLWLTTVIGLAIGWIVDHRRLQPCCDGAKNWRWKAEQIANPLRGQGWKVEFGDTWVGLWDKDGKPYQWPGIDAVLDDD